MADAPPTPPFRLPEHAGERAVLAKHLRGLGDPIRIAVLDLLAEHGELTVSALVEAIGEPQPKVSNHLATLRWCGFVETRRAARQVYYRIGDPRALLILALARELVAAPAAAPPPGPEPAAQPEAAGSALLVFQLGDGEYGLPLVHVQEVLRKVVTRGMPGLPPDAEGVASHRGGILVVRDAARRLGVPSSGEGRAVVVVRGPRGPIGWRVDRVAGIVERAGAALAPPPGTGADIAEVVAAGDRLVLVLRPAALGYDP